MGLKKIADGWAPPPAVHILKHKSYHLVRRDVERKAHVRRREAAPPAPPPEPPAPAPAPSSTPAPAPPMGLGNLLIMAKRGIANGPLTTHTISICMGMHKRKHEHKHQHPHQHQHHHQHHQPHHHGHEHEYEHQHLAHHYHLHILVAFWAQVWWTSLVGRGGWDLGRSPLWIMRGSNVGIPMGRPGTERVTKYMR